MFQRTLWFEEMRTRALSSLGTSTLPWLIPPDQIQDLDSEKSCIRVQTDCLFCEDRDHPDLNPTEKASIVLSELRLMDGLVNPTRVFQVTCDHVIDCLWDSITSAAYPGQKWSRTSGQLRKNLCPVRGPEPNKPLCTGMNVPRIYRPDSCRLRPQKKTELSIVLWHPVLKLKKNFFESRAWASASISEVNWRWNMKFGARKLDPKW